MGESSKLLDVLICFAVRHSPEIVYQADDARVGRMIYWGIKEEARETSYWKLILVLNDCIYYIYYNFPKGGTEVKRSSLIYFSLW